MTAHNECSAGSDYAALPCPFCGWMPQVAANCQGGTVHCENPDCFGPRTTAQYLTDALAQWNARTPETPFCVQCGSAEGCDRMPTVAQRTVKSGILTLDVEGWTLAVRVHDGGYEVSITEDGKCPASHYVRLDHEQADTLRDFMIETSPAQTQAAPIECGDCPPAGHPDKERCAPCPQRCSAATTHDLSCAADFLDDIEVDENGKCEWTAVANAQTHIRAALRCWSATEPQTVVTREAIAEIIDPMSFKTIPGSEAQSRALYKADRILALSRPHGGSAE